MDELEQAVKEAQDTDRAVKVEATLKGLGIDYVGEPGFALPVLKIALASSGGNPHELGDRLGSLKGKRVSVLITLDQGEQGDLPFGGEPSEDETDRSYERGGRDEAAEDAEE